MHSLIIVSKDNKGAEKTAIDILKGKKISPFDISLISEEKTIGIPQIRNLQEKIYLKPSQGEEKGIIINAETGITTEGQNALLKVLEEPPQNTYIIIVVGNKDLLLPTVLSRCKIIENSREEIKDLNLYKNFLDNIRDKGVGERLKLAQDLSKDKREAIEYLENLIMAARQEMVKQKASYLIVKKLQKSYLIIKNTNANLRLALENLFLSL